MSKERILKIGLLVLVAYAVLMYYAGSNGVLWDSQGALPTYGGHPLPGIADIGTPDPGNGHGTLEAQWSTDWFGNQFYPLGNGYPNNTSYPLIPNQYPL